MAATIGAIAALIGAGTGAIGLATANNRAPQQAFDTNEAALVDSRNNAAYVKALNALAIQQSRAGFQDSQGGSITYDPATNTWRTTLGPQQDAAQKSQLAATIGRNTTDMDMARRANELASRRGLSADLATGPALAAIENYQPITGTQLSGLLGTKAAFANNEAFRPLIQDTVRQASRTGTAAGPALADIGRQAATEARKGAMDSVIGGYTGAADINKGNLDNLRSTYATLAGRADPSFQFPGIAADDSNKTLAAIAADRAKTASGVTTGAGYVANQAQGLSNAASNQVAGSVPQSNQTGLALKGIGDILGSDKLTGANGALATIYNKIKNSGGFGSNDNRLNIGGVGQQEALQYY